MEDDARRPSRVVSDRIAREIPSQRDRVSVRVEIVVDGDARRGEDAPRLERAPVEQEQADVLDAAVVGSSAVDVDAAEPPVDLARGVARLRRGR